MAETDVQTESEQSRPRFELEQAADYSQFLLYSKSEILAVLRALIEKGAMITVHFDHGDSFLLTSMIGLAADNRKFILDMGSNEEMNRKALLADKLIFTTIVDKVKVQFSLPKLSPTQSEGRPAFLGSVPETVLRLQRREYFRLATPIAHPLTLVATVRRDDGSALVVEVPLLDLSGGGVGLMATPDQGQLFQRGDTLHDCKLQLPDEGLLVATLGVRSLIDFTTRSGSRHVHVGCEYVGLPAPRMIMLQRYITRVERERKARESGMA
jgi:c-di-GMP-binding flagellar brake protein YcgR